MFNYSCILSLPCTVYTHHLKAPEASNVGEYGVEGSDGGGHGGGVGWRGGRGMGSDRKERETSVWDARCVFKQGKGSRRRVAQTTAGIE